MARRRSSGRRLLGLVVALAAAGLSEVASGEEYQFSSDWVTGDAGIWEAHLKHLKGRAGVQGLEIGSFEGRSAIWFLENVLTGEGSRLTCVDVFPTREIEERFDRNLGISGRAAQVIKVKGYSQYELRRLEPQAYDFVYIDGCHLATCVLSDAVLSFELIKPGGLLLFDDYGFGARWKIPPHARPKAAIDAFLSIYRDDVEVLSPRGVVVVRRKESVQGPAGSKGLWSGLE